MAEVPSKKAFEILERALDKAWPWIVTELGREGVPRPKFRAVNSIEIAERDITGYSDVEKGMITLSASHVDKLLEMGYPEPFVEYAMISAIFHELKHYKDLVRMSPEDRGQFKKLYVEDPQYREDFEKRALDYGHLWARILRSSSSPPEIEEEEYERLRERAMLTRAERLI
jgi:hypothetical protein